jgi:hypothetical protein
VKIRLQLSGMIKMVGGTVVIHCGVPAGRREALRYGLRTSPAALQDANNRLENRDNDVNEQMPVKHGSFTSLNVLPGCAIH